MKILVWQYRAAGVQTISRARGGGGLAADLTAMAQQVIGDHTGDHRLADGNGADRIRQSQQTGPIGREDL